MSRLKSVGDLASDIEGIFEGERTRSDARFKRLALQESHRDKGLAIGRGDLINRTDIRMMESRCSFRFAQESVLRIIIVEQVIG